ncbi:MAG: hypothetical protein AAF386_11690 [Pseudomonadota bacterium]
MSDLPESADLDLSSRTADGKRIYPIWYQDLLLGAWGEGFVEKRPNLSMIFVKRNRKFLLVTFDNLSNVRDAAPNREPWACKFARDADICHLGVTANAPHWFRDDWFINRMQSLGDEGFFEGYERVLFAGTSMGAYAALAFAKICPAAHVAAFNPQTTLDPVRVPWESRFEAGRRQDWSLPFADGAEGVENQALVHVFYDPQFTVDKMHADRLEGPNVRKYHCRMSGHKSALFLNRMGRLPDLMHEMMFSSLTEHQFYQIYRDRRVLFWYRNALRGYYEKT